MFPNVQLLLFSTIFSVTPETVEINTSFRKVFRKICRRFGYFWCRTNRNIEFCQYRVWKKAEAWVGSHRLQHSSSSAESCSWLGKKKKIDRRQKWLCLLFEYTHKLGFMPFFWVSTCCPTWWTPILLWPHWGQGLMDKWSSVSAFLYLCH